MSAWLHEFDPTRPVHYEGAQGDPDPSTVDVISRFYPRVKQEYLNPGIPEGSDAERAENARWERLLDHAERTDDPTEGNAYLEMELGLYCLRMIAKKGDYNLYIYCYDKSPAPGKEGS